MNESRAALRVQLVYPQELLRAALAALIGGATDIDIVASTGDLKDAVRQAAELQPDLVIIEVPGEDAAFAAAAEIVRQSPQTRLVFLDDQPLDANIRDALQLQAAGYLTKQQSPAEIEGALRQIAHGSRVFAPEIARRLELTADGLMLVVKDRHHPLAALTKREMDVLVHLARGASVKKCAEILGIGESTVGNHKSRLMKKLDVHKKTVELTRLAIREGLISEGRRTRPPEVPNHIADFTSPDSTSADSNTANGNTANGTTV